MNKRKSRILLFLLLLSAVGCFAYMRIYYSPFAWYKSRQTVLHFLEENHPEYECIKVRNNLFGAHNCMYTQVAVPGSADKYFYVYTEFDGNYIEDSYEYDVLQKTNTERRLQKLYNDSIKQLFDDKEEIEDIHGTFVNIAADLLVTDKEYTRVEIGEISKQYGYLSVYLNDDSVDITVRAQTVMQIIDTMAENNLYFWNICIYVMGDNGKLISNTGNIEYYLINEDTVQNLLSKNILPA